jgi:hypothetical protein
MQTQLYRRPAQTDALVDTIKTTLANTLPDEGKQRIQLARSLRFHCQDFDTQRADLFYTALTPQDQTIWHRFLPCVYELAIQRGSGATTPYKNWNNYQFDVVPLDVLQEITFALEVRAFQWLQLRTPEQRVNDDPAIFGLVPGKEYLIARWGESLTPFAQIRWQVRHPRLARVWKA